MLYYIAAGLRVTRVEKDSLILEFWRMVFISWLGACQMCGLNLGCRQTLPRQLGSLILFGLLYNMLQVSRGMLIEINNSTLYKKKKAEIDLRCRFFTNNLIRL